MSSALKTSDILTWDIRIILYISSLSTLLFSENYCVNVCPFIDGLAPAQLTLNLFTVFILHILVREFLYFKFSKPFKNLTLPRHIYYLSVLSWIIAGIIAFFLHFIKYPDFPIGSHIKLLSSYWVLGAAILAQIEYILFEYKYKKIVKNVDITFYNENISKRIIESFMILTLAPAITIFLVLIRYKSETGMGGHLIEELSYIVALFTFTAIITSVMFGRMLKSDTNKILHSITDIKNGNYNINIDIARSDELGEISNALEGMATQIDDLNKEIIATQTEVVNTMSEVAETRSKETGNHVKRVALYSELLALHYGLDQNEATLLKQASPMHDLGKVGIPDSILNKPGKHTHEEFEIMKEHAQLGYDILKHSDRPLIKAASIVAHQHHEKWDGSGYPRGLKGEDIHIYGRITAVADVFDALGSDRCYKKAWEEDRILDLFKEQRGKHFDPQLIDLFFANLDQFRMIRDQLKDKFSH